jgi:hypothetical protein
MMMANFCKLTILQCKKQKITIEIVYENSDFQKLKSKEGIFSQFAAIISTKIRLEG